MATMPGIKELTSSKQVLTPIEDSPFMYENIAGSPVQEIVVSEPLEAGGRHPRHTANLSRFKFLLFFNH